MNTFMDSLIIEHIELGNKLQKLNDFLHGDEIQTLSDEDVALLEIQYSFMEGYLKVLARRLVILGYFNE